ncbi:E3 ubiquitin ligase [Coniosporium tulheliwenetii]|uniref:E3 ubiquitin ligase n=1 Tax=Coniosporium tulheliwenetii TaxID=3383036 RepID=A0ACC2ZCS2_9PEZI|nr:E3 ubiquitin ligase [Cladosporium sp. JES 115]
MDSRPSPSPAPSSRNVRQKHTHERAASPSSSTLSTARQSNTMLPAQFPTGPASATVGGASKGSPRHPRRATEKNSGRSSSKDSSNPKATIRAEEPSKENTSGNLLKAVQSDFDALRTLVTCKICDRLLYEPYIISCGHTYCYSCLCQWFVSNKTKKTCPDCRAVVKQAPAPAYLIREMILVFINRAELLPLGETLEQHQNWRFIQGCFRHRPEIPRAFRDEEDGVDRCPVCMYELEGGACIRCELQFGESGSLAFGESFDGFSDMDETSEHGLSSEELDAELDMEDHDIDLGLEFYADGAYEDWHDDMADDEQSFAVRRWLQNGGTARPPPGFGTGPRRRAAHSAAGSRRRSYTASLVSDVHEDSEMGTLEEEEEDDEDDEDSSMNDFINDEDSDVQSRSDASTPVGVQQPQGPQRLQRRPRRVVDSDTPSNGSEDDDEQADEDEGPLPSGRRRHQILSQRGQRPNQRPSVAPSVSTDVASSEHDLDEDTETLLYQAGWSPLGRREQDEMEEDGDDDSDGEARLLGGSRPRFPMNDLELLVL